VACWERLARRARRSAVAARVLTLLVARGAGARAGQAKQQARERGFAAAAFADNPPSTAFMGPVGAWYQTGLQPAGPRAPPQPSDATAEPRVRQLVQADGDQEQPGKQGDDDDHWWKPPPPPRVDDRRVVNDPVQRHADSE
jgi:hypothetical protein